MFNYPFNAHEGTSNDVYVVGKFGRGISSKSEMELSIEPYARYIIQDHYRFMIDDLIHLATTNSLEHITDVDTLAFARERIPSNVNTYDTTRFMIAFLYEQQIGFVKLKQALRDAVILQSGKYYLYRSLIGRKDYVTEWAARAVKIVEIMKDASTKISSTLAQQPDFIRNAAQIDLGEKTGLLMTSAANRIGFNTGYRDDTNNIVTFELAPNKSFYIEKLMGLRIPGQPVNQTDTLTIVAKNGPTEISSLTTSTNTTVKTVLAKDASKTLTISELNGTIQVSTEPILIPVATRELPDITDLEVAEDESVDLANLFTGIRVVTTVSSSDTDKVTVRVNSEGTSMGVTGVAVGTATVTVTGTNEAGNDTASFDVTVVAAD